MQSIIKNSYLGRVQYHLAFSSPFDELFQNFSNGSLFAHKILLLLLSLFCTTSKKNLCHFLNCRAFLMENLLLILPSWIEYAWTGFQICRGIGSSWIVVTFSLAMLSEDVWCFPKGCSFLELTGQRYPEMVVLKFFVTLGYILTGTF